MPTRLPNETHGAFERRMHAWNLAQAVETEQDAPLTATDRKLLEVLGMMERRMVRIETRCTNALRYMGLHPGANTPIQDTVGTVLVKDGELYVTSVDVPIAEVARAAVMADLSGEVHITVNNRPWGTINMKKG